MLELEYVVEEAREEHLALALLTERALMKMRSPIVGLAPEDREALLASAIGCGVFIFAPPV